MPRFLATISALDGSDPVELTRTALDLGFDALAVAAPLHFHHWESVRELLPRAVAFSLEIFLPYPGSVLPGSEAPFAVAASHLEERREAMKQSLQTVLAAERKEIPCVHVPPTSIDESLRAQWRLLRADDPYLQVRQAQLLARRAVEAPGRLDALRSFLARLLDAADKYGRRILLVPGGFPDEAPSPRETAALLQEFRGAPLGVWLDSLRASVASNKGALVDGSLLDAASAVTLRDFTPAWEPTELGDGALTREWATPLLDATAVWGLEAAACGSRESLQAGLDWLRRLALPIVASRPTGFLGI